MTEIRVCSESKTGPEMEVCLKNPRIAEDASMESGQKVTWDCIWFGSYPQSEVVCETDKDRISELIGGSYEHQYVTVSSAQWDKIISAEYDNYGDAMVDGVKYRRLSKLDAVDIESEYGDCYEWDGDYEWGDDTVRYFRCEPIKWRVLNVNGTDAFLVADRALDDQKYNNADEGSVTWETCTMRSWLNGYDSSVNRHGTDYSHKNFINAAFTPSECSAIKITEVINSDNIVYGTEGCYNTSDKIFLLSENEVCNSSTALPYGFVKSLSTDDEARRCKSSTYAKAMGVMSCSQSQYLENCFWWLRSPGVIDEAAGVDYDGSAYDHYSGIGADFPGIAVRPALHLDLSYSNRYRYAGTVSSDGGEDNL